MRANIRIYVTEDCPSCKEVIRYMERYKERTFRPFDVLDVGYNKLHFQEMLELGGFATPFIIVNERKLHTFDEALLDQLLEDDHG